MVQLDDEGKALDRAHGEVAVDMGRTDGKVGALLSALALALAVLAAVVPGRHFSTPVAVLLCTAAACLAVGAVAALLALLPEGIDKAPPGSHLYWARCRTDEAVLEDLVVDRRPARLRRRSGLLLRKFKLLRVAILAGIGAVGLLVLSLAVALVA